MTSAGTVIFARSRRKSVAVNAFWHSMAVGTEHCIMSEANCCIIAGEVSGVKKGAVLSATHFGKSFRQEARTASNADAGTPFGLSAVFNRYGVVGPSRTMRATRALP